MTVSRLLVLAIGLFALAGTAYAATPNMKEGLWEITVKMDMPGMPSDMPPQTMQRCITPKDFTDPQKMSPGADSKNDRCEMTDYKLQGNTATWKMACRGDNAMTGTGSVTYSGTSYTGANKMSMKQGDQMMNMTMNYAGKYIGACKQ